MYGFSADFNTLAGKNDDVPEAFFREYQLAAQETGEYGKRARKKFAQNLFEITCDTRSLFKAFADLSSKGGQSPGPNGHTYTAYDKSATWDLVRGLRRKILAGTYQPGPCRRKKIAKVSGSGFRELKLRDIEDRVVARGIAQILGPFLEPRFHRYVFGFRREFDRRHALATAFYLAGKEGRWYWVTADIRDAFDRVPLNRLLDILPKYLLPDDVIGLVGTMIQSDTRRGIMQGCPLSPLLLNVYLDHFLDTPWYRQYPKIPLLRYADDLLLLCKTRKEAEEAYAGLQKLVTDAGMSLKGDVSTAVCNLRARERTTWLGYDIGRQATQPGWYKFDVQIGDTNRERLRHALIEAHSKPRSSLVAISIIEGWITQLGPAYKSIDVESVCKQALAIGNELGFEELPPWQGLEGKMRSAHKSWRMVRKRVKHDQEEISAPPPFQKESIEKLLRATRGNRKEVPF